VVDLADNSVAIHEVARWHGTSKIGSGQMLRLTLLVAMALSACATASSPTLRVLGVHDSTPSHEVVFVQVTNPANRPMRLTRLEYTFAASGQTVSTGEMPLERDVAAGATAVVEVPLDGDTTGAITLQGTLTAELDRIEQTFQVSAQVTRH
jgi:Late embryogenesis abundant protein